MSKLTHLIYASKAKVDFTDEDIVLLLSKAREKNKSLGITGMLLYEAGGFIQVLEGDEQQVKELFDQIKADHRHEKVTTIIFEALAHRQFSSWTMGYGCFDKDELYQIDGMNDFFDTQSCLTNLDAGRARKILSAFSDGHWRLK